MYAATSTNQTLLSMMPPELLGEIFTYSSLHDPNAPLVLGAVCSTFYRIVRATPNAWTQLHLQISTASPSNTSIEETPDLESRCIRKTKLWFSMAGICSVDLHVEVDVSSLAPRFPPAVKPPSSQNNRISNFGDYLHEVDQWDIQLVPHLLHQFRYQIHGLSLHTNTVDTAERFFTALYPPQLRENAEDPPLPLATLSFHASSDGPNRTSAQNSAHLRHKQKPATSISLAHCHFPNLALLKLVNHPLPEIIGEGDDFTQPLINNACNLRTLSITYPIRFTPIPVYRVLQVLRSAPFLEKLEIEARVIDSAPPSPSSTNPGLGSTLSPTHVTSPAAISTHTSSESHSDTSLGLITLPHLAHLSLRINNLPAVLSHLLLPSLHTLRIDDLDGKRASAATQTAAVLRQVLVRMELPCENTPRSAGLQVLDMCSIALAGRRHSTGENGGGGGGEDKAVNDASAIWEWCFRRMRALRELRASKVDTEALWSLITPSTATHVEMDDILLPSLQRLSVADSSKRGPGASSVLPSSSLDVPSALSSSVWFSRSPSPVSFTSPSMSGSLLKFKMRKPEVHVDYHWMHDASHVPAGIDFLDFYGGR